MESNKLDKNIREKFENRTLQPSASAWERLSTQLDEQPEEKRKGWFFYIGIAASILVLVSIGVQILFDTNEVVAPKKNVVDTPIIDTVIIDNKIKNMFNEVPVEEALVKQDGIRVEEEQEKKLTPQNFTIPTKKEVLKKKINITKTKIKERVVIAKIDENTIPNISSELSTSEKKKSLTQNPNSRIKINSEDLLFAVTKSQKEIQEYYAKYNTDREEVLKTIKSELKKSRIKISPETILVEVERNIDDDDFQNNFMKSLKTKIASIATVIASRND